MVASQSELLDLLRDPSGGEQLRASALALLLGGARSFPELEAAARRQQLQPLYTALQHALPGVLENSSSIWEVRADRRKEVEARVRERIRQKARIWIIHGGKSPIWQLVAAFLVREMKLQYTEFNDPNAIRVSITARVAEMVSSSNLAVAVMTAADVTESGARRARQNVVHEIGVAQGRLGFDRVVVMRERGIEDFSNIDGIVYVPFEAAMPEEAFSDLRNHIESRLGLEEK
jgi:hypothetical protein